MINPRAALLVLLTAATLACGDDPKPTPPLVVIDEPDQPAPADMAEDLAADLADDLPADMNTPDQAPDMAPDMAPATSCPTGITWSAGTALPGQPRDHHVTFITTTGGPRLHVVGGQNYQTVFSDHWAAPIMEDGTLGAWVEEAALPTAGAGQSLVQLGDEVLLFSGRTRASLSRKVLRSRQDASGVITGWEELRPLPLARFHSSAAAHGRTLYVTGGIQSDGVAQTSLYRATLGEDGVLGEWELLELPTARTHHSSLVLGDHLYMLLGFEGNSFNGETIDHLNAMRAPLSAQGVGPWELVATSPVGISTHSTTLVDGCALTVGGITIDGNTPTYRSSVFALDLEGQPEWRDQIGALATGRSHLHQAPHHNGRIYIVGGSQNYHDVVNTVEIGTLTY